MKVAPFLVLLLASSAFAYNQQEITALIHKKAHRMKPVFSLFQKNDRALLQWEALQGPLVDGKMHVIVMKNNNDLLFSYAPYTKGDIYRSTDAGKHWKVIPLPKEDKKFDLISLDENRLVLAEGNKIYTSQDQGEHWTLSATIDQSCDKLFSPNAGLVLLTTNFSYSMSGLYRSTDGGQTFTPARLGISDDIPFFGLGGKDNILLTWTNGLYISTNNGTLWTQPSNNWKNEIFRSAAVNQQHDTIFIATDNLYKTNVEGSIWEQAGKDLGIIKDIKTDANNRLYAVGEKNNEESLYRSIDQGNTWECLHHFKKIIDFDLLDQGRILVNSDEGIMESDESQLNYTKIAALPYTYTSNRHVIALDKDHYFATIEQISSPLYGSSDAGKSWFISRNMKVIDIALFNQQIVALEYNGNTLEMVVSKDQGKTWQVSFQMIPGYCHSLSSQHGGLIINCESNGYFTQDLLHWTELKTQATNPYLSSYFSGKNLYISDGNFIKVSHDNGLTWTILLDKLNQYTAYISGYNDELLIIAIPGAGIIKMTNDGKTWDLISDSLSDEGFSGLIVIDPQRYLISTYGSGIFLTQDGGVHWIAENAGLDNVNILSLSLNKNTLLVGTDGSGVFKTELYNDQESKSSQ